MSYISEVANLFLSRCQNVKLLSPMDYTIIAEWEKQGIPLTVVLNVLNHVFDSHPSTIETIDIESIKHFQNEVNKNFANWLHNL